MRKITISNLQAANIWHLTWVLIFSISLVSLQPNTMTHAADFSPGYNNPAGLPITWTVTKIADTNDGACDEKDCSLREAIDNAAAGDTVVFASGLSGGTITLGSTLTINKNLTIDGTGLRPNIQISGGGVVRVISISSSQVKLIHLTIIDGYSGADDGGGIYNAATLYLTNCILSGNTTDGSPGSDGGGVYNDNTLIISSSRFTGHDAHTGGAIYNDAGYVDISDSTFQDNTAVGGAAISTSGTDNQVFISNSLFDNNDSTGKGGAISALDNATVSISKGTFTDNDASFQGGAVFNFSGTVTVTNSNFSNIRSTNDIVSAGGGGIYNGGTLSVSDSTFSSNTALGKQGGGIKNDGGTITVTSTTFSGNNAGYGGGIGTYNGTGTVTNSTFYDNGAGSGGGGGIAFSSGTLTVTNSTFSGNRSTLAYGGALVIGGTLHLENSILANTLSAGPDCYNLNGTVATNINNLIETNASDANACPAPISSDDPMLAPLADNGGPTETMALLDGSPAIDMGDDTVCGADPVNNLDQRGSLRPRGAHCDIGAFEWAGELLFIPLIEH